jgi:hypothetical protein
VEGALLVKPAVERQIRLRSLAAASERRNRPIGLVGVALALLVAGGAYAAWTFVDAADARRALAREKQTLADVEALVTAIEEARTTATRAQVTDQYRPDPQLLSKLASVQQAAGLAGGKATIQESPRRIGLGAGSDVAARVVNVRMRNVRLTEAMTFVNGALARVDGLFVTRVALDPTATGWAVEIDLARWERTQ